MLFLFIVFGGGGRLRSPCRGFGMPRQRVPTAKSWPARFSLPFPVAGKNVSLLRRKKFPAGRCPMRLGEYPKPLAERRFSAIKWERLPSGNAIFPRIFPCGRENRGAASH